MPGYTESDKAIKEAEALARVRFLLSDLNKIIFRTRESMTVY